MLDREAASSRIKKHYESVWKEADPWGFNNSEFDQLRHNRQLALLADRRYNRALEIGCGTGHFSRLLAEITDHLFAFDVADSAIERARSSAPPSNVEFRVQNIMEYKPAAEERWDLVVISETIYCLGWLYPLFDVGWLIWQLFNATCAGGRLLLVNTYGHERDFLLQPWLIDTYRDLCRNIGYDVELTLFAKDAIGLPQPQQ
jgi:SAM-dependent methyltransferase